jgi:hypothetical protein
LGEGDFGFPRNSKKLIPNMNGVQVVCRSWPLVWGSQKREDVHLSEITISVPAHVYPAEIVPSDLLGLIQTVCRGIGRVLARFAGVWLEGKELLGNPRPAKSKGQKQRNALLGSASSWMLSSSASQR